jgi:hypothetical protein
MRVVRTMFAAGFAGLIACATGTAANDDDSTTDSGGNKDSSASKDTSTPMKDTGGPGQDVYVQPETGGNCGGSCLGVDNTCCDEVPPEERRAPASSSRASASPAARSTPRQLRRGRGAREQPRPELPADGVITGTALDRRPHRRHHGQRLDREGRLVGQAHRREDPPHPGDGARAARPMLYLVDSAGARITDQIEMFPGRRGAGASSTTRCR